MKKLISVAALSLLVSGCGFAIVDTGHRGIKTRFGEVVSEPMPEGFYMYNPFTTDVIELDIRVQKWTKKTLCYTKDIQNVEVTYTINYRPDASYMAEFYKQVGKDWAMKLLPQIVEGKIKEVVGKYDAVKLVAERQEATTQMTEQIKSAMDNAHIQMVNFEVTNLDYNNAFENAVEAKVVAIQTAEEAKNKTVRIREEADQKIIAAKAEAESMRIRARALTQNKSLVEYEAVQKWNGVLPQYMMGNSVPFIQMNGK
ncbi:MAG: prohibitin family protein [Bdellovibrionales bacterium]|nr:prohibitin family protein [Bdellovibrionales bacterium]